MFPSPSRSEMFILEALQGSEDIAMEEITKRIPELSWNELFQTVDALRRRGKVIVRQKGFAYYLSLPRMSPVSAQG